MEAHTDERTIPDVLRQRLASAVAEMEASGQYAGSRMEASGVSSEALACLVAGESMLALVLSEDCASRDTALDLLTADALVTLAFERAADTPESLPAFADEAMRRIARLADTGE